MQKYRIIKIDELRRDDHAYLDSQDHCLYLLEYTSNEGYKYSVANSLIQNLKKPMSRKGTSEWQYKGNAIKRIAKLFSSILSRLNNSNRIWIPIPPSKHRDSEEYDDRILQILEEINKVTTIDIREAITVAASRQAAHLTNNRPTIQDIYDNLILDESQLQDVPPKQIILFDDMITSGTNFKACKQLILEQFPSAKVTGLFIARRVFSDELPF